MIVIDNEYYIKADQHCYQLMKKGDKIDIKTGKIRDKGGLFYTKLADAFEGYFEIKAKEHIAKEQKQTIKEAINDLKNLKEEIKILAQGF